MRKLSCYEFTGGAMLHSLPPVWRSKAIKIASSLCKATTTALLTTTGVVNNGAGVGTVHNSVPSSTEKALNAPKGTSLDSPSEATYTISPAITGLVCAEPGVLLLPNGFTGISINSINIAININIIHDAICIAG